MSLMDKPQLLPKDLLNYARKFTKFNAEFYILNLLKQKQTPRQLTPWELEAMRFQATIGGTSSGAPWGMIANIPVGTTATLQPTYTTSTIGNTSTAAYTQLI